MNGNKNLLIVLGEWWQYRQQHKQEFSSNKKIRHLLPTSGNVIFTLLVLGMLYFAQSVGALPAFAPAAVGTSTGTIAYQGRLADTGGTPLTNTYNMIFRLYNTSTGGTPLWEEQWTGSNSVKVSDGLFNVMLGSLTPIPQNIITGNDTLYLGITVGTDNEMSPRVQLGSVPFAVQALTVPDGSITGAKISDNTLVRTFSDSGTKIQYGAYWYGDNTCGSLIVTFPQPFTTPPKVFISQNEATGGQGGFITSHTTTTQFRIHKMSNCATLGNINWIAIGQ